MNRMVDLLSRVAAADGMSYSKGKYFISSESVEFGLAWQAIAAGYLQWDQRKANYQLTSNGIRFCGSVSA